ncbi:hypothetical protein [Polaribacter sp. R77954]|uniref:hypothetical protein n=1 Tax=Polaribacter sp. R77954 TaxID=3093870 RepID=UPI0037CA40ED
MKKFISILIVFLISTITFSQTPEKMSYQAVLRDANNVLLVNQLVGMQISILQGDTVVYVETQAPTTNSNGLVSLEIGAGSVLQGVFSEIDWSYAEYNIKTEIDSAGGNDYTVVGTSQLLSVPFALHSKTSANGISKEQSEAIKENTNKYSKSQIDSIILSENSIKFDSLKNINQKFDSIISTLNDKINEIESSTKTDVDNLKAILPKKLYFALDKELKIFTNNFIFKSQLNPASARINFSNLNGVNYSNYFSGTPINEGKWNGDIKIFNNLTLKHESNYEYTVVKKSENVDDKNILFIGDSYTDIGTYITYLKNDFENDGIKLNLIGTMGYSSNRHEALSGGKMEIFVLTPSAGISKIISVSNISELPRTGYPGTWYMDENDEVWSVRGMLLDENGNGKIKLGFYNRTSYNMSFPNSGTLRKTEHPNLGNILAGDEVINYSDVESAFHNPFWNPETNQLDFKYYINYWNFEIPDIVVLKFGWNDLGPWASNEIIKKIVNNAKVIIDKIHVDFPKTKVIFSIQGNGQLINTRNIDTEGQLYSRLKFTKELSSIFEDENLKYDFVYLAPTYAWLDPDNGYSSDGVHPNNIGFHQIADCLYPIFCDIFNKN